MCKIIFLSDDIDCSEYTKKYNVENIKNFIDLFSIIDHGEFENYIVFVDMKYLEVSGKTTIFDTCYFISSMCLFAKKSNIKVTIGAVCDYKITEEKIKELQSSNIKVIYPTGLEFDKEERVNAIEYITQEKSYIPRKIENKFKKSKNKITHEKSPKLSPRQQQVFDLVIHRGASNKSIAKILKISESTVKLHMTSIFKKYAVRNRTQLVVFAQGGTY